MVAISLSVILELEDGFIDFLREGQQLIKTSLK